MKQANKGFVLVATIWFLAALSLFVGYFAIRIDRAVETALRLQEQMQVSLEEQATINTTLYLGLTRSFDLAGIKVAPYEMNSQRSFISDRVGSQLTGNELRLDNRSYQGIGGTFFSLQDAASLISLRNNTSTRLRRLLLNQGVTESETTILIERLEDYVDRDNEASLNGAEFRDYQALGYIPPTNRFLLSPLQLLNIPGWDKWLGTEAASSLMTEITIYPANRQNYNGMTQKGMATLGSLEPDVLALIVRGRQEQAYLTIADVNEKAGALIPFDPLAASLYPSNYLRLTTWHENSGQTRLTGITLDPSSPRKPWYIDYQIDIGAQARLFSYHDKNTAVSIPATVLFQ